MHVFPILVNENVKIYRRFRTWMFAGIVLLGVIIMSIIVHSSMKSTLGSAMNAWVFTLNANGFVTLVAIFAAVIAGDSVASEFATGTIKLLLVRPVTRTRILWAKYFSTLLFALYLIIGLLLVSFLLGGLLFGFSGAMAPHTYTNNANQVLSIPMYAELLRTYAFMCIPLLMTVTVSFMISTLFRSSSLAIAISILLLFLGNTLVLLLSRFTWDRFILFTNENLGNYFEGRPLIHGMTLTFSIVVLLVYFLLFHVVAWFAFNKRDVAA